MRLENPVISEPGRDHGDPFVLDFLGTYYLFHTGTDGVYAYTSRDLAAWRPRGKVLEPSSDTAWAQTDFWAPEVVYRDGEFLMYVAATRLNARGTADDDARRLGVARAQHPLGPYTLDRQPLLDDWAIDGHPFRDVNGTWWLFYNVRNSATRFLGATGCGNVVAELERSDSVSGPPHKVAFPSELWEGKRDHSWFWNEGATVLERRGTYYHMYSGGFYGDETYGVGLATAASPTGPWLKDPDNPLFVSGERIRGPGHHSLLLAPDGVTPYACYHGYVAGQSGRKIHLDRLHWVGDRPQMGKGPGPRTYPTESAQDVPAGPVYTPGSRHWKTRAWVRGGSFGVGSQTLSLPGRADTFSLVEVVRSDERLSVCIDGVPRTFSAELDEPALTGAEVAAQTTTSFREDARIHRIGPHERRTWSWTESGELEVRLALKGSATITAGHMSRDVDTRAEGRYQLVTLLVRDAEELAVEATSTGATVTDIFMTARAPAPKQGLP